MGTNVLHGLRPIKRVDWVGFALDKNGPIKIDSFGPLWSISTQYKSNDLCPTLYPIPIHITKTLLYLKQYKKIRV